MGPAYERGVTALLRSAAPRYRCATPRRVR